MEVTVRETTLGASLPPTFGQNLYVNQLKSGPTTLEQKSGHIIGMQFNIEHPLSAQKVAANPTRHLDYMRKFVCDDATAK
ncbi:MAG TPA: hypothetical protein VNS34_13515 [Rhizobiaceae bacterium]|nr:hypothetical protein [Rhizobiaceae bacterium]